MYKFQMSLGALGVNIVFVSDGTLALVPVGRFPPTLDISQADFSALFSHDSFTFFNGETEEQFSYGTMYDYRQHPLFLKWLQAQQLQNPFV